MDLIGVSFGANDHEKPVTLPPEATPCVKLSWAGVNAAAGSLRLTTLCTEIPREGWFSEGLL
jgi:hypothetical protein